MAIDSPPAAIRRQAEGTTTTAAFPLTTTSRPPPTSGAAATASASVFAPLDLAAATASHQPAALVPQRAFPSLPPSGGDAAYVPSEYASPMRVMMDIDRSEVTTTSGAPYDSLATTGVAVPSAVAVPGGGSYQQQLLQRQSSGGGGGPFSSSGHGSSGGGTMTAAAAAAGALSAGLDPSSAARQVSLTVHRLLQLSTAAGAAAPSGTAAAAAAAETSCGLQVEVYSKLTELVAVTPSVAWAASLPALASAIAAAGGGGASAAATAGTILASLQLASALASCHPEMMQVSYRDAG